MVTREARRLTGKAGRLGKAGAPVTDSTAPPPPGCQAPARTYPASAWAWFAPPANHPVARLIATGRNWFDAWSARKRPRAVNSLRRPASPQGGC